MTARSPRASAVLNTSRIAVLLPVPVVPMSLKCLVSSSAATGVPASVTGVWGSGTRPACWRKCRERRGAEVGSAFETIAPRFAARPGGYTRLMRTGYRKGDSAELAMVELVGSEFDPNAKAETPAEEAKPKSKGVGGRLRAAAERLRGKKEDHESGGKKVTAKPSKGAGAGRRATTPRKAGGS